MPHYEGDLRAPDGARFAILASRWNPRITDALVAGARKAFADNGVAEDAVDVIRVPGAWEIPLAAARIAAAGPHAAIVALGCVVRGDTRHYEQVADGCAEGLMRVALDFGMPVPTACWRSSARGRRSARRRQPRQQGRRSGAGRHRNGATCWSNCHEHDTARTASTPSPVRARVVARCRRSTRGRCPAALRSR